MEQKLSFEQALQRLEQVVKELETGDLSLDSALALFQEGVALARQCGVQLDEAEAKIEKLLEAGRTVEFTTEA
ncbi:MAG TPA: exodeoxyribonuclease VII small subunit [Symbiobacteriaceae bacterium]|nr:exodeoxyribonuclease VII small subunit [Symbiobacteriaceae bacterium]